MQSVATAKPVSYTHLLVGLLDSLVPVDQESLLDLMAEENVLEDRQLREQR